MEKQKIWENIKKNMEKHEKIWENMSRHGKIKNDIENYINDTLQKFIKIHGKLTM